MSAIEHAVFISNRPFRFAKSVNLFKGLRKIYVFAHENQQRDFEAALEDAECDFPVEFLPHNIPDRPDGLPPLGAIRYHALNRVQSRMGRTDIGWMADDDATIIRYAQPGKSYPGASGQPKQSYRKADPQVVQREIVRLARAAREYSFPYFTHLYNARGNNGYDPKSPFQACPNWNGFFGFFKASPNPFDPTVGDGEDYDAAYRMVRALKTLPILRHNGLTIEFEFVKEKYQSGRRAQWVVSRYPEIAHVSTNCVTKVPYPSIQKKVRNNLKQTVLAEFR